MLEIEKRGFLTEEQYNNLLDYFKKNSQFLGEDDKYVVYYIYKDKLLKAVKNISKGNAKISLKMNKIGNGSVFPETEVVFSENDYEKIKFILDTVSTPEKIMSGIQKRKNFFYKKCEFSVKWSEEWGYHFEVEKVVNSEKEAHQAEADLEEVSKELGIKILTEEELKKFTEKAEKNATNKP